MSGSLSVLIVGPLPPPSGGMANQTRQLARLLAGEGVEANVLQTNAPYRPAWIESVRGARALFRLVPYLLRLWRTVAEARVVHVMANSGWAWFLFAVPAIRIAALRGRPVLVNYRGGLAREFLARSGGSVARTLRHARVLVVPSKFLQEAFGSRGIDAMVIPNVVDLDVFHEPTPGAPRDPGLHIVIARNLERIYGIDVALRAIALVGAELPGLRVSIAGSGPERGELESLATQLGIADRVHFTGRLDVAAMAALYRQADLVLNPSRADNMPNSILEALATGVPVVSTDVGGVPFLVEHAVTAWLVPADDPRAMAAAVTHVLQDAELREQLRQHGLALALSCSWPMVRERWLAIYRELAGCPA